MPATHVDHPVHVTDATALLTWYCPLMQSLHNALVETKYLPALQKAHDVPENPLMFWNFPAKQLVQTRSTMSDGVVPL